MASTQATTSLDNTTSPYPNTVTGDSSQRAARDPKKCGVCNDQAAKYKCPRCTLPYCSVACSRAHKENHPPDAPPPEKPAEVVPARPAPRHHFDVLLEHRAEIDRLFKKYPGLDRKLLELAGATDPPKTDGKDSFTLAMEQQARTVITGKKEQPWTEEIGMQRGLDALRESRTDCTNVADGLREYCELVTHLLSKEQRADPIEAVREKYVTQEARTIDRLRQEETANDD